jgi:membrane protease YdiL (CAAX protease family)
LEDFWQYVIFVAGLVWLAGALFFVIRLGVFSPTPLRAAPARQSSLSLPVIGAVIVLYFLTQTVSLFVGYGLGLISPSDLVRPTATTTSSQPATSQATSASAPETAPTTLPPASSTAAAAESDTRQIVIGNAIVTSSAVLTLIPLLILLPGLFKNRSAGWGLHPRQSPAGLLQGLFGFLLTYPFLIASFFAITAIYSLFHHEMSEHPTFDVLKEHGPLGQKILVSFVAIIVAPFSEEIFFRGILQTTLIQRAWGFLIPQLVRPSSVPLDYHPSSLHRWGAILLTSAAFAYVHQSDQAPIIFVLSLALGYVYERTGNLWAPIALHLAFNSTEIATFFATS